MPPLVEPGVRYAPLMREPLVAALPARRRWPQRLTLGSLAQEPFVLFPRQAGVGLYDLIVGYCRDAGFTPRIEQEAIQMPTIVSLVAAGMGVALVPASLRHMRRTGVVYRPLAETSPLMESGARAGAKATRSRRSRRVRRARRAMRARCCADALRQRP